MAKGGVDIKGLRNRRAEGFFVSGLKCSLQAEVFLACFWSSFTANCLVMGWDSIF